MAKSNVTLKQIAQVAGVSTTTVHRVLNDKEGCGEELKAQILGIARDLGYSVNVSASSLRKKTAQIALVFPSRNYSSRFFMGRILEGYHRCQEELIPCNAQFHEYFYDYDDPDSMCPILKDICMDLPLRFDGIALWGMTNTPKITAMLNRLQGKGIPVVMMERSPSDPDLYDCCVGPDDLLVGSLAGELIRKLTRRSGKVLIVTQELGYQDPNGVACIQALASRPDLEPFCIPLPMQEQIRTEAVRLALEENPDVVALYSTSARHTLASLQALQALGGTLDAFIGSEVFEESMAALESGTISALMNKCPHTIGYQALQLLYDRVARNESLPKEYRVLPQVVLQANMHTCRNY